MTFPTKEESRYSGQPVDLYLFRYGTQPLSYFAYTNAKEEITLEDGITYVPATISRDRVTSSGSLDKASLKIRAQRDISVRDLYIIYPPSHVTNLTIRQGHLNDPDEEFLVCWSGRVLSVEREDSECIIAGEPISTSMRQPGLRRYYQIGCTHYLYGPDCRADRDARTVVGIVTAVGDFSLTVSPGWNDVAVGKYVQGEVRWLLANGETQIRTIMRVVGNVLTLNGPTLGVAVTDVIDIAAGCNHQTSSIAAGTGDCTVIHENGPNFGGCKWIPKSNPIGIKNTFY